jgi:hypothetical protein
MPMVKESFGTWFRGACKAAGVPGSAHGLRKAGATRAANSGATEAELEAIIGWKRQDGVPLDPPREPHSVGLSTNCPKAKKGTQSRT